MQLYHDKPVSQGVENALKRARQLVDFKWTPVRHFPSGVNSENPAGSTFLDTYVKRWRPLVGMNYSSVRKREKYLCFNVSFETFFSALANPNSVLYEHPVHGEGPGVSSYYGIVCSAFASYVVGFPYRTPNYCMAREPGITEVDATVLENIQLGDLIQKPKHVAVITDIQRDVNGKVHIVTVSESVRPLCLRLDYTPEEFYHYWLEDGYHVYRYEGIHNQTYTPSPYAPIEGDPVMEKPPVNTVFMSNYGTKANLFPGEDVEFSFFEPGWEELRITGPNGLDAALPIRGDRLTFTAVTPGFYTAVCRKGDQVSLPVEFGIVRIDMAIDRAVYAQGDTLELSFANAEKDDEMLLYAISTEIDNEKQRGWFTAEEIAAGRASIPLNVAPGKYYIYTLSKNKYGFYASEHAHFTVE